MFLTKKLRKRRILFIFFDAESSSQLQTFFTLLLSNSFQKFCRYVYLDLEGREEQINFFKKILYIYIYLGVYIVATVLHTFQPNPQDSLRRLLPFLCLHYS